MDQQHVDAVLDAYALGALEPAEVAAVEEHLATCARCRDLAARARVTAQTLLYVPATVSPPPGLRARVLSRVREEASHSAAALYDDREERESARRRHGGLRGLLRSLIGVESDPEEDFAAELARLLADPGCAIWSVGATPDGRGANARLIGLPSGREAALVTSGLRALPTDHAYQVWYLRDGVPAPGELFSVGRDGRGYQLVRAPLRLDQIDAVAVTPEPAGGSPAPTGPIMLMGKLTE